MGRHSTPSIGIALVLLLGGGCAKPQPSASVIESNVRAEWTAFTSHDGPGYGALLDDEYVGVEVDSAGARNKQQAVAEVDHVAIAEWTLSSFDVRPLGPDVVMAVYEASLRWAPPAEVRFLRVYVTELWRRRGEQWKAWRYQETRVK